MHALSTAALTYTISKGCSSTSISSCSCSSHPDEPPNGNFKWGGCGDNIQWGSRFSKQFVDSKKKNNEKRKRAKTPKYDYRDTDKDRSVNDDENDVLDQSANLLVQINNHNGEIGRKVKTLKNSNPNNSHDPLTSIPTSPLRQKNTQLKKHFKASAKKIRFLATNCNKKKHNHF